MRVRNATYKKRDGQNYLQEKRASMYFVSFSDGAEQMQFDARDYQEATVIRDFLVDSGFKAIIVRQVNGNK